MTYTTDELRANAEAALDELDGSDFEIIRECSATLRSAIVAMLDERAADKARISALRKIGALK